jgi:hypothetical protein
MDVLVHRCAGLDVHRDTVVATVTVVVAFKLAQHGSGVSLVDDQEAVEEFAADCPDESLRDRIRPRCPHRRVGARNSAHAS